jgi:hypothetical protein
MQAYEKQRAHMEAEWEKVVRGVVAISRGKRGVTTQPAEITLPEPGAGRYLRYAVDRNGNFSLPKIKGRKHPHWKPSA